MDPKSAAPFLIGLEHKSHNLIGWKTLLQTLSRLVCDNAIFQTIWPPSLYSLMLLTCCSHVLMMSVPEAPDYVTVSGPLSWLREAMSEIFAEPCIALLSRSWLYLVISEHRLWMRSRPLGHFIQLTQRKRNAISFTQQSLLKVSGYSWVLGCR